MFVKIIKKQHFHLIIHMQGKRKNLLLLQSLFLLENRHPKSLRWMQCY